jgi:drug/metabolite transporter (DMT)-like permease
VLAIVLLHEAPTANQLLGVVLVIGGIGIATVGGMTAPRVRRARQAKAGA